MKNLESLEFIVGKDKDFSGQDFFSRHDAFVYLRGNVFFDIVH